MLGFIGGVLLYVLMAVGVAVLNVISIRIGIKMGYLPAFVMDEAMERDMDGEWGEGEEDYKKDLGDDDDDK